MAEDKKSITCINCGHQFDYLVTTPVTGEIEARLKEVYAQAQIHLYRNTSSDVLTAYQNKRIALEAMSRAYALDRASGDGVRAALVTATSDNTLYYLRSIYRQFKEFKDHFNSEAMQRVEDVNPGPSIGSEVLADNADWLDCHIDWLERTARAALSAVSIPRPEPIAFTVVEGGEWYPWGSGKRATICGDRLAHAIKFSDGSIFDMVNGWRK